MMKKQKATWSILLINVLLLTSSYHALVYKFANPTQTLHLSSQTLLSQRRVSPTNIMMSMHSMDTGNRRGDRKRYEKSPNGNNARRVRPLMEEDEKNWGTGRNGDDDDEELGEVRTESSGSPFLSGFVSILGNPNVGKSTLMNQLLGESLCITSPKPQTTRHRILGILTVPKQYQLVFSDTPGMLAPAYKLQETMQDTVRGAMGDADTVLLVTDVYGESLMDDTIMQKLSISGRPIIVAINKLDIAPSSPQGIGELVAPRQALSAPPTTTSTTSTTSITDSSTATASSRLRSEGVQRDEEILVAMSEGMAFDNAPSSSASSSSNSLSSSSSASASASGSTSTSREKQEEEQRAEEAVVDLRQMETLICSTGDKLPSRSRKSFKERLLESRQRQRGTTNNSNNNNNRVIKTKTDTEEGNNKNIIINNDNNSDTRLRAPSATTSRSDSSEIAQAQAAVASAAASGAWEEQPPQTSNKKHGNARNHQKDLPALRFEELVQLWQTRLPQAEIVGLSARTGEGVDTLLMRLLHYTKPGPKYFPSDTLTNRDERFFTAEIIRECLFFAYKDEIPYSCEVVIDSFKDKSASLSVIEAGIVVSRASQKPIVIGKQGGKLKELGTIAREKLEKFLGRKVFLSLRVRVDEGWRGNAQSLTRYGYLDSDFA